MKRGFSSTSLVAHHAFKSDSAFCEGATWDALDIRIRSSLLLWESTPIYDSCRLKGIHVLRLCRRNEQLKKSTNKRFVLNACTRFSVWKESICWFYYSFTLLFLYYFTCFTIMHLQQSEAAGSVYTIQNEYFLAYSGTIWLGNEILAVQSWFLNPLTCFSSFAIYFSGRCTRILLSSHHHTAFKVLVCPTPNNS